MKEILNYLEENTYNYEITDTRFLGDKKIEVDVIEYGPVSDSYKYTILKTEDGLFNAETMMNLNEEQ